jgi:hypothetical protein
MITGTLKTQVGVRWRSIVQRVKRNVTRPWALFRPKIALKPFAIPEKPLHFPELKKGYYCTQYVRLAAQKIFGLTYAPAPAWRVRNVNHVVWRAGRSTFPFELALRPGLMVGIRNPKSLLNRWWRPYTHTALYVGKKNGEPWIMHRVGSEDILEPLRETLKREKWIVKELLEPEQ